MVLLRALRNRFCFVERTVAAAGPTGGPLGTDYSDDVVRCADKRLTLPVRHRTRAMTEKPDEYVLETAHPCLSACYSTHRMGPQGPADPKRAVEVGARNAS